MGSEVKRHHALPADLGPGTGFVTLGVTFCEERHEIGLVKGVFAQEKTVVLMVYLSLCPVGRTSRNLEMSFIKAGLPKPADSPVRLRRG